MFKRKTYDQLVSWKREGAGSSALLVEGARRVGKSTIVEEFVRNEYESYVLVDFSLATDDFKRTFLDLRTDLDSTGSSCTFRRHTGPHSCGGGPSWSSTRSSCSPRPGSSSSTW